MASRKNWEDSDIFIEDNLYVMRGMNSGHIDLIYLDPPFNSKHNYAAPIGSKAAGAAFKDTWTLRDVDDAWHGYIADKHPALYSVIETSGQVNGDSDKSYLIYMAIRILEMKRLLKPTGSIYLHCDPTMSHYLKMVMDAIFGKANFRNEIIWCYSTSGRSKKFFAKKHDVVFLYALSNEAWKDYRIPVSQKYLDSHFRQVDSQGRRCRIRVDAGKKRIYYPDEGMICNDWWTDISYVNSMAKERTGYPTQKPLPLLRRIIEASTKRGDVVFDPFCGCATSSVAAQELGRNWVACDISPMAGELVVKRMEKELGMFYEGNIRTDLPTRTTNDLTDEENEIFGDAKIERYNSLTNKYTLFGKQDGKCNGCGLRMEFKLFEVDHIIPQDQNGSNHISNLQLLCGPCNRSKGARPMDVFMAQKRAELEEQLKLHDSLSKKIVHPDTNDKKKK